MAKVPSLYKTNVHGLQKRFERGKMNKSSIEMVSKEHLLFLAQTLTKANHELENKYEKLLKFVKEIANASHKNSIYKFTAQDLLKELSEGK